MKNLDSVKTYLRVIQSAQTLDAAKKEASLALRVIDRANDSKGD